MPYRELTEKYLNRIKSDIQNEMSSKGLDNTGAASDSLEIQENKLLGFDYIYYLVNGRGPGKFPPVENMRDWVRQKLRVDETDVNSVAFLVGRKISELGTSIYNDKSKGLPLEEIIDNALNDMVKELPDYVAVDALSELTEVHK